uniref:G-protein coupled receptors family 1 profile domain-containing protein n=1 Tax=Wuchereria bancrofti TaxID=6293 RepID=A0AAF5PYU1_WUCBA
MVAHSCCIMVLFLILPLNCHAENTTNVFDIRDECNTVKKYVAVVLFSLLLLYGIISDVLLMVVFCSHNNLYSRAFIFITSQIIISGLLNFIPQVVIVLVEILDSKSSDVYHSTWIHRIFVSMNTFLFFATLHFTFLLAINRFVAISLPQFNAFFESLKFYFLLISLWLLSFVISLVEFYYCIKTFNASNLQWTLNCIKRTPESGAVFMKIRYAWTLALPIAMFAIYVLIFCNIRSKRKNTSNLCAESVVIRIFTGHERKCAIATSKYERMMLIQAVFVCGAMEIQIICFNFLSKLAIKLAGKEIEIPVNILTNCFVIFTAAVLPTANLIFVKRFRESVKQAFVKLFSKIKIMKKMSTVTPVTLTMSKIH